MLTLALLQTVGAAVAKPAAATDLCSCQSLEVIVVCVHIGPTGCVYVGSAGHLHQIYHSWFSELCKCMYSRWQSTS